VPIGLCRYLLGKHPDPEHPYKDLLRLGNRAFFLNGVWVAGALAIITTNVQAVPAILPLQEFVTNFLTAHTFTLSWRFQLNPLEGIGRHQRIIVTLNKDPHLDDLRRKRSQDRAKINVQEKYEIDYWSKKFGVTPDELRDAVKRVGPSAEAVEREIKRSA